MISLNAPILLATSNDHKVAEIRQLFGRADIAVQSLVEAGVQIAPPDEDQPTFSGNARKKALHYARATGRICLADDSGLMVDALDGAPGVRSARFAGVEGDRRRVDAANNARLVERLADVPDDQLHAQFVCVMALANERGVLVEVTGMVHGHILLEPRGSNGFGYDSHFLVTDLGRTSAELSPDEKNAISHRGQASQRMFKALTDLDDHAIP